MKKTKKLLTNKKSFAIIVKLTRKVSSVGRASALQAEGHRFEPYTFHQENIVALILGTHTAARSRSGTE